MLSRSTRPPAYATDTALPPSVGSRGSRPRGRVVDLAAPRVVERTDLPGDGSTQHRAVLADPWLDEAAVARIARLAPRGASETVAKVDQCRPRSQEQVFCADDARCVCPLSGHITDAEREVMNGIFDQAARLATAMRWIIALVALAALVLLLR